MRKIHTTNTTTSIKLAMVPQVNGAPQIAKPRQSQSPLSSQVLDFQISLQASTHWPSCQTKTDQWHVQTCSVATGFMSFSESWGGVLPPEPMTRRVRPISRLISSWRSKSACAVPSLPKTMSCAVSANIARHDKRELHCVPSLPA